MLSGLLRFKGSDQERAVKAQNVMEVLQIDSVDQLEFLQEPSGTTPLTIAGLTPIQCSRLQMVGAVLRNNSLLPDGSTPENATLDQWEIGLKRANSNKGQYEKGAPQEPRAAPGLREQLHASKAAHLSVVKAVNVTTAGIKLVDDNLELLHQELAAALSPLNLGYLLNLSREEPSGAVAVPPMEDTNGTPMTERGPQLVRVDLNTRVNNGSLTAEDAAMIATVLDASIKSDRMRHCRVEALGDIIAAALAADRNKDAVWNAVQDKAEKSAFQFQERKLTSNLLYSILIRILSNTSFYHILTEDPQDRYQDGIHAWARINQYDSDPKLQARKIEEDFRRLKRVELVEGKTVAVFLNEFERIKSSIIKRLGPGGCQARDEASMYNTFIDGVRKHPTLADVTTSYRGLNGGFDTVKEISERLRNAEKDQDNGLEQVDDIRRPAAGNRAMAGKQTKFEGNRGNNFGGNVFKVAAASIPPTEWDRYNKEFDKFKWQLEKKTFADWQKKGFIPTEYSYDHATLEDFTAARVASYNARLEARRKGRRGQGSNRKVEKNAAESKKESKTETAIVASANRVSAKNSKAEDTAQNALQYDFGDDDDYDYLADHNHLLDDHL